MKSVLLALNDSPQASAWHDELRDAGWTVQGQSPSFLETRRHLARRMPAVLVTDLRLQDGTVIDLIRTLCAGPWAPRVQVLVLAAVEADPLLLDALQAGADNFFMVPGAQPGALAAQVRDTLGGGAAIAPWIARRLLAHFAVSDREPPRRAVEDLSNPLALTAGECTLLRRLSIGEQLADLARHEGVGPRELTAQVRTIYRKMQWALRAGDLRLT